MDREVADASSSDSMPAGDHRRVIRSLLDAKLSNSRLRCARCQV